MYFYIHLKITIDLAILSYDIIFSILKNIFLKIIMNKLDKYNVNLAYNIVLGNLLSF